MEKKHTPTPWMVSRGAQQYPFSIESGSKTVALIPTVKPMGTGEFETRMSDAIFETEANAEFICRAVNNHYQLVNALKILLHYHDSGYVNPAALIDVILPKAKQAITAATE